MSNIYHPATGLRGIFRDVLRNRAGRVTWDSGRHNNTIVSDCHRLLAGLLRNAPNSTGLQGLQVGSGSDAWDTVPATANSTQTKLFDPQPFTVPADNSVTNATFKVEYLTANKSAISGTPTNILQIVATLGPGVPPWGAGKPHVSTTLREFGLIGRLNSDTVLINYVIHPAITKDPDSTLERIIWLVF